MTTQTGKLPFVCLAVFHIGLSSATAETRVQFDASRIVACRDVTTEEFAEGNADEKLVQAHLQVSVLVFQGQAEAVTECLYRFETAADARHPASAAQVVDYLPKNTMDSILAGNIRVQRNDETSKQLDVNLGGSIDFAHGNLGGSRTKSTRAAIQYELLPPQEMVAAVGTTGRGTGVYFKLRGTPQISLEGSRDFLITLRVPADWRGGYLRAACQAMHRSSNWAGTVGSGAFVIPLYLDGDAEAKQHAEDLSDAENRLYALASQHGQEIRRRSQPTIAHELSLADPRIPDSWLYDVLQNDVGKGRHFSFERHLPQSLQEAISDYRVARRRLNSLASRPREPNHAGAENVSLPPQDMDLPLASNGGWTSRVRQQ